MFGLSTGVGIRALSTFGALVAMGVVGAAMGGCNVGDPITEIFVRVDSDLVVRGDQPVPCSSAGLCGEIRIVKLDILLEPPAAPRTGFTAIVHEQRRGHVNPPVSWGIVARSDRELEIEVVARGYTHGFEGETPLVEQRARLFFVPDHIKTLCLALDGECLGRPCAAGSTCVGGLCVPSCIDSAVLPDHGHGCQSRWPGDGADRDCRTWTVADPAPRPSVDGGTAVPDPPLDAGSSAAADGGT